jgi:hypothetical protein
MLLEKALDLFRECLGHDTRSENTIEKISAAIGGYTTSSDE